MREVSSRLKKPNFNDLCKTAARKHIIGVGITGVVLSTFVYYKAWNWRRDTYRKFYETYDAEKEFEAMRKKNLFDSC